MEEVEANPMDVDRWELVISPVEYLRRFHDTLADVQLISRAAVRNQEASYALSLGTGLRHVSPFGEGNP